MSPSLNRASSGPLGLIAVAVAAVSLSSLSTHAARGQTAPGPVVATPFGSPGFVAIPTWQPVDFAFFSNPLASFDDFDHTAQLVFHEPQHLPAPFYGIKPGAAHAPPYDGEVSANVAAAGFTKKNVFTPAEFSGGRGVYLFWNVIATGSAPVGSSPDFAQGRIIPNGLFPIVFAGQTLRDGSLFDPNWAGSTPKLTGFDPPIADDGYSHFPVFTGEIFEFQDADPDPNVNPQPYSDPAGLYIHQFMLTDAQGNGWRIDAPFAVTPAPEPASPTVVLLGGIGLMVGGRRRRPPTPCQTRDSRAYR
jgi:hypothetical protein